MKNYTIHIIYMHILAKKKIKIGKYQSFNSMQLISLAKAIYYYFLSMKMIGNIHVAEMGTAKI